MMRKTWIIIAIKYVTPDMLAHVWQKIENRFKIFRVSKGTHGWSVMCADTQTSDTKEDVTTTTTTKLKLSTSNTLLVSTFLNVITGY